MTNTELADFIQALDDVRAQHATTPEKARAFLRASGVIDESGALIGPYARSPDAQTRQRSSRLKDRTSR